MWRILLWPFLLLSVFAPQDAGFFEGTWRGSQGWDLPEPPPAVRGEQEGIRLELRRHEGGWTGHLTPFLGGADGAVFTQVRIEGGRLLAEAKMGPRPLFASSTESNPATEGLSPEERRRRLEAVRERMKKMGLLWKEDLKILLELEPQGEDLVGRAQVWMGEVKWLQFTYHFSRQKEGP